MKTKKEKLLIAIIIMIFVILTLGCNKSFALTDELTNEEKQKILEAIPNEIKLDITESEYIYNYYLSEYSYEDGLSKKISPNLIREQIDLILKEKNISFDEYNLCFKKSSVIVYFGDVNSGFADKENSKEITILCNPDKRNAEDEAAVKNIQIEKYKAYEYEWPSTSWEYLDGYWKRIEEGDFWYKSSADSSISVIARNVFGGDPINSPYNILIYIFNNGVLYDERSGKTIAVPVLDVPSSVTDSELNNYIISKLKDTFSEDNFDLKNMEITFIEDSYLSEYFSDEKDVYYFYLSDVGSVKHYAIKVHREEQQTENSIVATSDKNVRLDATTDVVPENTVIEVKTIEKSNITVLEDDMNFVAYDIKLKSNGVEIQPNGKVKISIPVPDGFDTSKLVVYRIEDDGSKVEYNVNIVTIDGKKYAQFETEHFSTYVLAETTKSDTTSAELTKPDITTETSSKPEHKLDDTPKTGSFSILPYLVVTGIIISLILVKNKNKKRVK